ncbi:tail fiber protein [Klebsiella phage KpLz-2_45]|uniref:tail fiber protein n=1 Tax=Klebsiella phage KpLz-2_45 TaxID=2698923 RepID=UPI001F13842C|nr:tail fiber protein [Klebsiella phage KpLz-2_45]UKS71960.1 hypothetical protein KpLz245_0940 [Klebsiella phage KpLz-2_45]
MQTNFIQPSGTTSVQSSAEMFSQLLNIPLSSIATLDKNVDLTIFSFGVDPASKEIFNVSAVTGVVSGISISGTVATITTDKGVFQGAAFPAALTTVSIATIADLRKFEPWYAGQKIILERAVQGGPLINIIANYDSSDVASADNDFSIMVTPKGARWKVDVSKGVDIRLAGVKSDGTGTGAAIQKIVDFTTAKVSANKNTFGVSTQIFFPQFSDKYVLEKQVKIPSFFSLVSYGNIYLVTSLTNDDAIVITNEGITGVAAGQMPDSNFVDTQGSNFFNANGGSFFILGPGKDTTTGAGIRLATYGTSPMSVRDLNIKNFRVKGFKYGIRINYINFYCNTFSDFNIADCVAGVFFESNDTPINSGEKIVFKNGVIGNTTLAHFLFDRAGIISIVDCSLDYTDGDVFKCNKYSSGVRVRMERGWIEGFGGKLINQPEKTQMFTNSTWNIRNIFEFLGTFIYPNNFKSAYYSSTFRASYVRQMISAPDKDLGVTFDSCAWELPNEYWSPYYSLTGQTNKGGDYGDGTGDQFVCVVKGGYNTIHPSGVLRSLTPLIGDYQQSIMGWRHYFNSVATDTDMINQTDSQSQIKFSFTGAGVTITKLAALDDDGYVTVKINSTATSNITTLELMKRVTSNGLLNPILASVISIKQGSDYTSGLSVYNTIKYLDYPTYAGTVSGSVATVTESRALIATDNGTPISTDTHFTKKKTITGLSDVGYIAFPMVVRKASYADQLSLSINLTGFTGSVFVKLPVFWFINE